MRYSTVFAPTSGSIINPDTSVVATHLCQRYCWVLRQHGPTVHWVRLGTDVFEHLLSVGSIVPCVVQEVYKDEGFTCLQGGLGQSSPGAAASLAAAPADG